MAGSPIRDGLERSACERAGSFAFDFEEQELDEAALRAHVWAEMARYEAPAPAKLPAPR